MCNKQRDPPDISVLHVPFDGNRHQTAMSLLKFFERILAEDNLTEKFGPISFVDIPVATHSTAKTCMVFIRFVNKQMHHEFIARYNGQLLVNDLKLVISFSASPAGKLKKFYIKNKMGWYNRDYPPYQYQSREASESDSTIDSKPKTIQIKIEQAKTSLSPAQKLSVADRLQSPNNDLTIKLKVAIEELKTQKEVNLMQKKEISSLKNYHENEVQELIFEREQLVDKIAQLETKLVINEKQLKEERALINKLKINLVP